MKTITTRFALLMAAAAVVPLLAYGGVSITSLRSSAEEAVVQGNLNVARRAAEQIELYLTSSVRILNAVAADLRRTELENWQQERILRNYVLEFPEYVELTLLDEHGRPTVSSRLGEASVNLPSTESTTIEGALMSRFSIDDDLLPTAVVASPTAGEGRGWLVGRLNLEQLWRMVDSIRVGEQGYALVVTREGQLLAHGDPNAKSRVARGDDMSGHPLLTRLAAEKQEATASGRYEDVSGPVVGVAARLNALDWTVIVEQAQAEAFAIPNRTQRQLAIAISLALMAMLAAGYYSGRVFINPILRLTRGTRALAEGRLDERVPVESEDELGQLGAAFNDMAGRLVELQEDVRRKERQATFGRVVMGLVHDLSNPIQNIGNACKLMVKVFDDVQYREQFQRTMERELTQVKRLFDDLRNVARPAPMQQVPVDLNVVIGELVDSMQPSAREQGITLESARETSPLWILGDVYGLSRVLRNLVGNALQATPPGGKIVLRNLRTKDHGITEVADSGSGITPDRLETIFDDFVTTKRRGLGLGLAISRRIVEQLNGTISVTSALGVGTTFTLRFPLMKSPPPNPPGAKSDASSLG